MRRTGSSYRKAGRHFATEIMGDDVRAEDIKYVAGRAHRWQVAEKKKNGGRPTQAEAFAAALPQPPPQAAPIVPVAPREVVPGSLADLAIEGTEEDWLVASMRQLEDACAKRVRRGSDITGLKRLAADLRRRLSEIREPPAPSIEDLPENERRALLVSEVPSWPDYVLEAAAEELSKREAEHG